MKILLLTRKYFGTDGHSTVMNNIALSLIQKGVDVKIGAFDFIQDPPKQIPKVKLSLKDIILFNKKINQFDLIHNFQGLTNYLSLFNKKPFIFHYLGAGSNLQILNLKVSRILLKKSIKNYFASSTVSANQLHDIMKIESEIVPLAVSPSFFNYKEKTNTVSNEILLLTITRMIPYKRNEELLNGFKKLLKNIPKARLQIIGQGPQFSKIKDLIKELGISDKIELAGTVPHSDIKSKYLNCDVYISTSSKEAFPLPFIESMAIGKPVVASNIPIHEEIIKESQGGEIYELGNIEDFVDKVTKVINNKIKYTQKSKEYAKKWNYENLGRLLIQKYSKLLEK
jgi:glycosyltransferase involved in cell wall biosynthesis